MEREPLPQPGIERVNDIDFASNNYEHIDDLVADIEAQGTIRNDAGAEYTSEQIISAIRALQNNVDSGKYDRDLDGYALKTDLLTITRASGLRKAVENSIGHLIVLRERSPR